MISHMRMLIRAAAILLIALLSGCEKTAQLRDRNGPASSVDVAKVDDGSVTIKTSAAEFRLSPHTYLQASLIANGAKQTLDDPSSNQSGSAVSVDGKLVNDFIIDPSTISIADAGGKLGPAGKRVEATAKSAASGLEEKLSIEVYDDFPTLAIWSAAFQNNGPKVI